MPPVRVSRRRRSSLAYGSLSPAKAGTYGVPALPSVTFAPNVTQESFTLSDNDDDYPLDPSQLASSSSTLSRPYSPSQAPSNKIVPQAKLFPPSATPAPPPARKRVPPGKRRSLGYIPRPPNAFMLFRADFVRQKHVPGSIETNHGSLSKIIGNCWRQLPLEEKKVWEVKAKHAKAEHKLLYPEYKFKPVHNRNKGAKGAARAADSSDKKKVLPTPEDERRCEQVAALLLEGMKGEELAQAVREMDRQCQVERDTMAMVAEAEAHALEAAMHAQAASGSKAGLYQPIPMKFHQNLINQPSVISHRRSSSVPLPDYWPPIHMPQADWHYGHSQPATQGQDWNVWQQQEQNAFDLYQQQYQEQQDIIAPTPSSAIALPTLLPRALTPTFGDSTASRRQSRMFIGLGQRRASSAQPLLNYQFQLGRMVYSKEFCSGSGSFDDFPTPTEASMAPSGHAEMETMELPEVDTSLFEKTFLEEGFGASTPPASQQHHSPGAEDAFGAMSDLLVPPLDFGGYQMGFGGVSAPIPTGYEMGPVDPLTTPSPPQSVSPMTPASVITMSETPPPSRMQRPDISLEGVAWAGMEHTDDHDTDVESQGSSSGVSSSTSSDHGSPKMYQGNVISHTYQSYQPPTMDLSYGAAVGPLDAYAHYSVHGGNVENGGVNYALGLDIGAAGGCQVQVQAATQVQDVNYGYDVSDYGYSTQHPHWSAPASTY